MLVIAYVVEESVIIGKASPAYQSELQPQPQISPPLNSATTIVVIR
ncbi:hypothetical protein [Rosistilla oblonga]